MIESTLNDLLDPCNFDARRELIQHILRLVQLLLVTLLEILSGIHHPSTPYHTSSLSGHHWVLELLGGHPDHIQLELGVCKEVFLQLITELWSLGMMDSKNVMLEEQLAIFLYMCVTGLTTRHVRERFQCSNNTISQYVEFLIYWNDLII